MVLLAALFVHQYFAREPLMPVRQLATTFPGFGIVIAMTASASAIGLMELVLTAVQQKSSPTALALEFLPEFGAAVVTAVLFAFLFRTRFTPVLAVGGLAMVAVAAALLTGLATGGSMLVAAGSGLIGLGVGASVSPALFITGFSLRSAQIQRVFAFLELLRGVTAFLVAPILLYLATAIGGSPAAGTQTAIWICLAIAVAGALGTVALFVLGGERLQAPDLKTWTNDGEPPGIRRRCSPACAARRPTRNRLTGETTVRSIEKDFISNGPWLRPSGRRARAQGHRSGIGKREALVHVRLAFRALDEIVELVCVQAAVPLGVVSERPSSAALPSTPIRSRSVSSSSLSRDLVSTTLMQPSALSLEDLVSVFFFFF